jgi:hypothetical protein
MQMISCPENVMISSALFTIIIIDVYNTKAAHILQKSDRIKQQKKTRYITFY